MPTARTLIVNYLPTNDVWAAIEYDTTTRAMLSLIVHNGDTDGTAYARVWGTEEDPMTQLEVTAAPQHESTEMLLNGRVMGDDGNGNPSPDPDQGSNINYAAGWPLE